MMKKITLVVLGLFVMSSIGFAGEGKFGGKHKKFTPEQKAKWETVKKERTEYFKNLETLITKYNKASEKEKVSVKKDISALVSAQTDKDIIFKKERIAAKREKLAKMETKVTDIEADKTAFVNKKVDFMLSEEGQEKIKKMKEMKNKKGGKNYKKDFKKNKDKQK